MLIKSVPDQKAPTQKGRTYNIKGRENTRARQEHHQETAIPDETEQDKNTREPQVGKGQEHDNNQGKGTKDNMKGREDNMKGREDDKNYMMGNITTLLLLIR